MFVIPLDLCDHLDIPLFFGHQNRTILDVQN